MSALCLPVTLVTNISNRARLRGPSGHLPSPDRHSNPDRARSQGLPMIPDTYRRRARILCPLGPCSRCGSPPGTSHGASQVHHIDGDYENNNSNNLSRLCRVCHLKEHPGAGVRNRRSNRACRQCGASHFRSGLCHKCYNAEMYKRRPGCALCDGIGISRLTPVCEPCKEKIEGMYYFDSVERC